ncbi:MAG: Hsp20/alpha crystallin family protein [Acidimicrobiia bacterium]
MELRPLLSLERDVQSMFDRMFGRELAAIPFRPTVDVVTEDDALVATFEIPGIVPGEDVEILVEDEVLVVKGEKSVETKTDEKNRHIVERRYGSFERHIPLPEGAEVEAITASYDKGILTVRVPVHAVEPSARKKIPVSTG